MVKVSLKEKKESKPLKKSYGFSITDEQDAFIKAHKEVNWSKTMRQQLDDVISELSKKK